MKRSVVAVAALAALAGCGSTVPVSTIGAQSDTASAGGLGLGATTSGSDTSGTPAVISSAGSASAAPGGVASTASADTAIATSSGSIGPVVSGAASPISVGFIYTTGRAAAAAAVGAAITSGDELAQWKLLVADVNAHGGLAGHKIAPVYFGRNSTGDANTQDSAACADFTQDHHVALAMTSFQTGTTYVQCMAKKGIPTVLSLEALYDEAFLQRYPTELEPAHFAVDRQAKAMAEDLFARHYFTGATAATPAVNGILTFDTPEFRHAASVLTATLRAHGVAVKDARYIPNNSTGGSASAASSAELAFAAAGINHVMILDANGWLSFLFMTTSATQAYRPRYGLTSQSSGTHLADLLGGNARTQLKDAMGIGWIPVLDLNGAESGKQFSTPARVNCRTIMIKGGESQGLSSPGAELVALGQCDDLFAIQHALSGLTGALTGTSIVAAFGRLGTTYAPAGTFRTVFSPARHDGVAAIRDMSFATDCVCFHYVSGQRAVS